MREIRLIKDRTDVHSDLKVGTIGIYRHPRAIDVLHSIYFPSIKMTVDVFDRDFEIILTPEEEEERRLQKETAYDVVFEQGPRGGFQIVKYKCRLPKEAQKSVVNRKEGLELLQYFKDHNIPVTEIIIQNSKPAKKKGS